MPLAKIHKAHIEHVLVFYDGPQLVLISDDSRYKTIGMAVVLEGYSYPLFCAAVLGRHFDSYMAGKVDLLFLYRSTPKSRLYITDAGIGKEELILRKATQYEISNLDIMPEPGMFSTVHTHPLKASSPYEDARQRFLIDGIWEAKDFSTFHGKMHDTYSLLYVARRISEENIAQDDVLFLQDAILDRPWQGGGSYLSFYSGVRQHSVQSHPLRVSGIEYHSPGYVDLSGNRDVLDEVLVSISRVKENITEIAKTYQAIRKSMQRDGLLGSSRDARFSSARTEKYVESLVHKLAGMLSLPNSKGILNACDGNVAVFAKVVMSYFRRVKAIANFYIEGRIQTGEAGIGNEDAVGVLG